MIGGKPRTRKALRAQAARARKAQQGGNNGDEPEVVEEPVAPPANANHPEKRENVPGHNGWEKITLRANPAVIWYERWENDTLKDHQWHPPGEEEPKEHPIIYTNVNGLPDGWQKAQHKNNDKEKKAIWYAYTKDGHHSETSWNIPKEAPRNNGLGNNPLNRIQANANANTVANNGLGNNPLNRIQANANTNTAANNGLGNNPLNAIKINNAANKANTAAAKANNAAAAPANNGLGNNPLNAIQVNKANTKANTAAAEANGVANGAAVAANAVNNASRAVVNAANSGNTTAIANAKNAVVAGNNAFKVVTKKIENLKNTLNTLAKTLNHSTPNIPNTKRTPIVATNTVAERLTGGARRRGRKTHRRGRRSSRKSRRNNRK
jgi:hypothetical protein